MEPKCERERERASEHWQHSIFNIRYLMHDAYYVDTMYYIENNLPRLAHLGNMCQRPSLENYHIKAYTRTNIPDDHMYSHPNFNK